MEYDETIRWLFGLQKFGIKLGLANITALLGLMGNPERSLRSVVVAGTNGKGSTARFLASLAESAGLTVGLYTSPHLQSFNERIAINGAQITDDEVVAYTQQMQAALTAHNETLSEDDRILITFFEFTTAMAAKQFADAGCDLAVFEVGMGGRLDATNAMPAELSVITSIGREHTAFLGDTIEEIAFEKAGVIKEGRPAVIGVKRPGAREVIVGVAAERNAPAKIIGTEFDGVWDDAGFNYRGLRHGVSGVTLGIAGRIQSINASCALAAFELLCEAGGAAWDDESVRRALAESRIPARLEKIRDDPPVILDVSHNPEAIEPLVEYATSEFAAHAERPVALVGMMSDKDAAGYLSRLGEVAGELIVTRSVAPDATPAEELAEIAQNLSIPATVAATVPEAMDLLARKLSGTNRPGLIVGSFYVVGEVMDVLDAHPEWPATKQ